MELTQEEKRMLAGEQGTATRKAMEILVALGAIYGADRLLPVTSVQVAGVSFDNLGEAGLEFLSEMAAHGGRARVLTTLNPAGMDVDNWKALGIDPEFAAQQKRVIEAYTGMGILPTCSCTPYLFGNLPHYGEHIAWAESSAVCYANSVLGARTNREGGPSALAASLTGKTPRYGMHLSENRRPTLDDQGGDPVGRHPGFWSPGNCSGTVDRIPQSESYSLDQGYHPCHPGRTQIFLRQHCHLRRPGVISHGRHHARKRPLFGSG